MLKEAFSNVVFFKHWNIWYAVHLRRGLFGAKVTGAGVGGTVAVLMRDSSQSRDELQRTLEDYQARTGLAATVFEAACSFGAELGAGQHFSR